MITKSEVMEAIARCEPVAGWGTIDTTPVYVSRGDLFALIEAAKRATYINLSVGEYRSNSDYGLHGS